MALTSSVVIMLFGFALLSYRVSDDIDVTANNQNTLSHSTQKVLASLPDAVKVTVYIKNMHPLKQQMRPLLERYRRYKKNLTFQFIDPDTQLQKAHELNVGSQGLTVTDYHGRSEKIDFLDESTLTNALLQLANGQERWVSFLTGHGERSPVGVANFDMGLFAKDLKQRKTNAQPLNLAEIGAIPENSSVLVLATPRVPLLAGELHIIENYLQQGGNLLILTDPEDTYTQVIEQALGIYKVPGVIKDDSSKLYGIDNPNFVLLSQYNRHPIIQGMENITLYPAVAALNFDKSRGFEATPFLQKGNTVLGYALTRQIKAKQQRIVVIGDGDFLSNTFLGNVGNRDMGVRIMSWLTHDDQFMDVPIKQATGRSLQLSPLAVGIIGFGFLMILPLGLIGIGFWVWRRRQRR
jgi:ABC-type uncharacterized transport system involved in gliding motility auxiliary subunit